ncbi:hypothetical protein Zm00014a_034936 [Zea mays]|uniref:Uncharacterized protein n=1 Tax=Zea mays TaxID=4577 RepID=A0A317YCD1_MAIZE|nr:hypothetical protein Zm00014a_034936 [Zea mays]
MPPPPDLSPPRDPSLARRSVGACAQAPRALARRPTDSRGGGGKPDTDRFIDLPSPSPLLRARLRGRRTPVRRAARRWAQPRSTSSIVPSVANLQGMARPSGVNMASFSAVSNSGGAWRVFLYIFMVFLVTGRRKKNRPVRVFPTDKGTLWKTRSADGHAESWGRLISQSRLVRRFVWSANLFIRSLEERVKVPWPVLKKEVLLHYFELEYLKDVVVLIMKNARTENQVVQKSTCDFEGLMVSNRGYDEVHITRGCKKIDI